MSSKTVTGNTSQLRNFHGELMFIGAQVTASGNVTTPLLSATGGLGQLSQVSSREFSMGNFITLDEAQEHAVSETASITAPASEIYESSQLKNYVQIYQKRFALTYYGQSDTSTLEGLPIGGGPIANNNSEAVQRQAKLLQMAKNFEWSMFFGTGTAPSGPSVTGTMEGIHTGVVADGANVEDAGNAALSKAMLDALEVKILASCGLMEIPTLFCGSKVAQAIRDIYAVEPRRATVGGISLDQIVLSTLGTVNLVYDPVFQDSATSGADTNTELVIVDLAKVRPVIMPVPGKGTIFFEELSRAGASKDVQLYGQISVDYGSPKYHGVITNINVS